MNSLISTSTPTVLSHTVHVLPTKAAAETVTEEVEAEAEDTFTTPGCEAPERNILAHAPTVKVHLEATVQPPPSHPVAD